MEDVFIKVPLKFPEVLPLEYEGEPVLTTRQLAEVFDCSESAVRGHFTYSKVEFIEGVDYLNLKGRALVNFKNSMRQKFLGANSARNFNSQNNELREKLSVLLPYKGSSLHIWTKSGALKLSKFIGTDKAKIIYSQFALKYFTNSKIQPNLNFNTEKAIPKSNFSYNQKHSLSPLTDREKLEILLSLIEKATDENLRDELIKAATKLI